MSRSTDINADFDAELLRLRDYLEQQTGMSYERGRLFQLAGRVNRRIAKAGFEGIREYLSFLQAGVVGAREFKELIDILKSLPKGEK